MPSTSSPHIEFNLVPKIPSKLSSILFPLSLLWLPLTHCCLVLFCTLYLCHFINTLQSRRVLSWEPGNWPHHYQDLTSTSSPRKRRVRIENLGPLAPKPYAFVWLFLILNIKANTGFCCFLCFSCPSIFIIRLSIFEENGYNFLWIHLFWLIPAVQ